MTLNRELFHKDPTASTIPNSGITTVAEPQTLQEWEVLHYELSSFVCEGAYHEGLERVLSRYIANLNNQVQPAVWVSGFYGSGKSHFVRVLEYLWRDVTFPDQVTTARSLVGLPDDIAHLLRELTTRGKQAGGLWSAAGTLSSGAGNSIRLALLGIVFRSAGLPEFYPAAQLVLRLKRDGIYEQVKTEVEKRVPEFNREVREMYVSSAVAESLLLATSSFGQSVAEVGGRLTAQYPIRTEITNADMIAVLEDVLALVSTTPGRLPCTLLVLDELQQFIGENAARAIDVQEVVEACRGKFGSRLLIVATGQAAIQGTPQLERLQARFPTPVMLSDTDVEKVVRAVVLQKKPEQEPALRAVLDGARGEIDRHLAGTKIGPTQADVADLVADYPLLPVRRRFWERVLRAIDRSATSGQVRTQLRVVHEATREVADKPVGWTVPGDAIYFQLEADLLQRGLILSEVREGIRREDDGTADGRLRARVCALVVLIGALPPEVAADTGIRANVQTLADLLVEDLIKGSADLRQRLPDLLNHLAERGVLMRIGEEFRWQTRDGAEWEQDFRQRSNTLLGDVSRIASERAKELQAAARKELGTLRVVQGQGNTGRSWSPHFGSTSPPSADGVVPVWIRDEWSVPESVVQNDAQAAGTSDARVYVFLPKGDEQSLRHAIASVVAAQECLDQRAEPTSDEGKQAKQSMITRLAKEREALDGLIKAIIKDARVYQGGGNPIDENGFPASVRAAVSAAVVRLFPKFPVADHASWPTVLTQARAGNGNALATVGFTGSVEDHPVCREIRSYLGGTSRKGRDVRDQFTAPPYGWAQETVDGALLALTGAGIVRATQNGQLRPLSQLITGQIGVTDFTAEGVTVTAKHRIEVRGLLADVGFPVRPGEEAGAVPTLLDRLRTLADAAGGDPPLPQRPSLLEVDRLRLLAGNEQFVEVSERRAEVVTYFKDWSAAQQRIAERRPRWQQLMSLLAHATGLPEGGSIAAQVEAIRVQRSLLADPDPVTPLRQQVAAALRLAVQAAHQRFEAERETQVAGLASGPDWGRLPVEQQESLLAEYGLVTAAALSVGDDDGLLRSLNDCSLGRWAERTAALPHRAEQLRDAVARLLEPKTVRYAPPKATFHTQEDVLAYVDNLRNELLDRVQHGPVMI